MSWSNISLGDNPVSSSLGTFSGDLPNTYAIGDLLLSSVVIRAGSETITSFPNYTLLFGEPDGGCFLYGRYATGSNGSPDANDDVSVTRSGTARAAVVTATFRDSLGGTALGSIVHASADSDVANNTAATLDYPGLTITVDNCLVIVIGEKQKAVDEATTVDAEGGLTVLSNYRPAFTTSFITAFQYAIQTTATNLTAGQFNLTTWTEGATRAERALSVALLATAGAPPLDPIRLIWRV